MRLLNTKFEKEQYGLQFLFFILILMFSLFVGTIITLGLAAVFGIDLSQLSTVNAAFFEHLNQLKVIQLASSIFVFMLPAILFAMLRKEGLFGFLELKKPPYLIGTLLAGLIMLVIYPILMILLEWNSMLVLPDFLSWVEDWMRESERQTAELTQAFLTMNNLPELLFNLFLIALVPALAEEFLFRGVLQKLIGNWTDRHHLAIFIAAFAFSFIHFQFFGFLARMAMGVVLGYLFYWSKNLWYPIIAHFLNNGVQVILVYVGSIPASEVTQNEIPQVPWYLVLVSGLLLCLFAYLYRSLVYHQEENEIING